MHVNAVWNSFRSGTKLILESCKRYVRDGPLDFEVGTTGANHFFFPLGGKSLLLGADQGKKAIGKGCGCLWYLYGVKIRDLVPFKLSQTLVDHQRPSWYVLGCFSLNKIPEISITRTILMIWLEPLEHIDQGIFIFGIFQLFAFELLLFMDRHQLLPLPHRWDSSTYITL